MLDHVPGHERSTEEALDHDLRPLFSRGAMCGKYRVLRLLACGGMSQVFEAVHVELRKHVALKILSPSLRTEHEAHMRFAAEAINAACLVHTNIVDVVDCGVVNGLPYLVTNLLVGCDLATHLSRRGKLQPTELIDILLPVARAIAFGHERGIMHRDLKPQNIFLHQEGERTVSKVLDFGVSRMLGAPRITASMSVVGTPLYMAPEQARAEKSVGPAADQYAFGVIMYEGLTGRLPRTAAEPEALLYSVAYGSFPPPSKYVQLPNGLEQVVLKAMAPEPKQRFESMEELATALLPYASKHEDVQPIAPLLQPTAADEILDVAGLLQLLRTRRRALTALLTGIFMLATACLWLDGQTAVAEPAVYQRAVKR